MYNFLWEKFEGVIFYLQSLKYLQENAENGENWAKFYEEKKLT